MDKRINMNIKNISIILSVLIISGIVFYWYELRPVAVRKVCTQKAFELIETSNNESISRWNWIYSTCLHKRGLEK